jgi:hypothetical protein
MRPGYPTAISNQSDPSEDLRLGHQSEAGASHGSPRAAVKHSLRGYEALRAAINGQTWMPPMVVALKQAN